MIHIKKLSGSRDAGKSIMSRSVFDGSENWKINVLHLLMVEFHILMMVIPLAMQGLYHINLKPGRRYTEIEPALNE